MQVKTLQSKRGNVIAMESKHTMADPNVLSPKSQQLTFQMRAFIDKRLGEDGTIKPLDVFAWLIKRSFAQGFASTDIRYKMAEKQQTKRNEACFGALCKEHPTPLFELNSPVLNYWMIIFLLNVTHDVPVFHIDSTHSIVKQKYPVFVFGVSDCRGKFFPWCTYVHLSAQVLILNDVFHF
ncbi:hypothetical protein PHMEG_00036161 [Phytophthora megakarya]|uniref:MULE transposase domain-containing protein n=1 Tax=Phytophthora megakarya TaxID=4795 RepID=A0A225UM55_9STRA|nr:hypothetical protein PHMEG_00036161 [Phytophthora megakarya]